MQEALTVIGFHILKSYFFHDVSLTSLKYLGLLVVLVKPSSQWNVEGETVSCSLFHLQNIWVATVSIYCFGNMRQQYAGADTCSDILEFRIILVYLTVKRKEILSSRHPHGVLYDPLPKSSHEQRLNTNSFSSFFPSFSSSFNLFQ